MAIDADQRILRTCQQVERVVSAVILIGMAAVVLLATRSFLVAIRQIVAAEGADLDDVRFRALFDRVLAAVIAVELAQSIRQMVAGEHGFAQLRIVVTIGMLAVVRRDGGGRRLGPLSRRDRGGDRRSGVALVALRRVEDRRET